jgi:5-methyltetrahydrofolate--homocysteine methyltransferase
MGFRDEAILIFDGACGSNLQTQDLQPSIWEGRYMGCNEYLNLAAPQTIADLHQSFIDAGCNVLESNTFGANRVVLSEYGLEDRVVEINTAAVQNARAAIAGRPGLYVAGSVGPGTKLVSLGHISHDEMRDAYAEQIKALVDAGVDAIIIETTQDLMQAKIAVMAALEAGSGTPVILSVTIETTGTMLLGSDISAICTTFAPFDLFALGLNCATGPEQMEEPIRYLSQNWPRRISVIPNAGIPEVRDGQTFYPLSPGDFASKMRHFVTTYGVSVVGGCCGTAPAHIRALADAVQGVTPPVRDIQPVPSLSSLYTATPCAQEIPPLLVGERMNTHGSKRFKRLLLADDFEALARMGVEQENEGAHLLDVCVAYAGRPETEDMVRLVQHLNSQVRAPLVIDTTRPDTVEAALRIIPGRCLVNSINLEDGGTNARLVLPLIKRYGAAVVALTIDEDGMAMTADKKRAVAQRIYDMAVHEFGLRPCDLFFDPLTFTVGSGDTTLERSAVETIRAIRDIHAAMPGVFTLLGLSNVSFGLPAASRKYLNSVFLAEAIEAGLTAAIVDAARILPLSSIGDDDQRVCRDLLYDVRPEGESESPLERYIAHFGERRADDDNDGKEQGAAEEQLEALVMNGDRAGLEDVLEVLRVRKAPFDIINQVLVPTMRRIGELFGAGKMLLPFVLKSAEVMKAAVSLLEPHMEKQGDDEGVRVLLATVRGDVHDIGKNLVDIILSNNGYRVFNIGINQSVEQIIEQAREHRVDIIGLSGLLVKSALEMQAALPRYREAGLTAPVLLGGAALTRKFVATECAPAYHQPVVFCADAFDGLQAVQDFENGALASTTFVSKRPSADADSGDAPEAPAVSSGISRDYPSPTPPFFGVRHIRDIDPAAVAEHLNEQALFRGRWGFRKAKMSQEEYERALDEKAWPVLRQLKARYLDPAFIAPQVSYGYFRCYSEGDALFVIDGDREVRFDFPRQRIAPGLCLADYYKTRDEGGDVVGFFVGTVGERIMAEVSRLFAEDAYHDYLMLHGFAVELADALAQYFHDVMRRELGLQRYISLNGVAMGGQGERYGFGYPTCPDLAAQELVFQLLNPAEIGVALSENHQMVPEATTSAIVSHHPQASYFSVK